MDRRVRTSVTIQECVQAINRFDGHRTQNYSAPLILRYKTRKGADSAAKDVSHPHSLKTRPQDIATSRSKSVLGVRLEYQDYLLSEYLRSKCTLAFSSRDLDVDERPLSVQSRPQGHTVKKQPVYQNYFTDQGKIDTLSVSSGSSNSSSVGTKCKPRFYSSSGSRSGRKVSREPSAASSGKGGSLQTNLTGSGSGRTFSFRYTKR